LMQKPMLYTRRGAKLNPGYRNFSPKPHPGQPATDQQRANHSTLILCALSCCLTLSPWCSQAIVQPGHHLHRSRFPHDNGRALNGIVSRNRRRTRLTAYAARLDRGQQNGRARRHDKRVLEMRRKRAVTGAHRPTILSVNTLPVPLEMIGSTVITSPSFITCLACGSG